MSQDDDDMVQANAIYSAAQTQAKNEEMGRSRGQMFDKVPRGTLDAPAHESTHGHYRKEIPPYNSFASPAPR